MAYNLPPSIAPMTPKQLLHIRLIQQQLPAPSFSDAAGLVGWMGAVQAQDYAMAKWALGLRLPDVTDSMLDDIVNKGEIIRTHILRPTWHFVAPADIRWMLQLTAPRVHAYIGHYYRKLELDKKIFSRSNKVLEKILQGHQYLTRTEIAAAWENAKINTEALRLNHLLIYAELEGIICSGPLRGKHPTYALLEERVQPAKQLLREEALATLALRYYQSHGPATVKDFAWWSGLSLSDARAATNYNSGQLQVAEMAGLTYYYRQAKDVAAKNAPVLLLPNFDEFVVAYADKNIFTGQDVRKMLRDGNPLFSNTIVINGMVSGTWKRAVSKASVDVVAETATVLSTLRQKQLHTSIEKFKKFLGA